MQPFNQKNNKLPVFKTDHAKLAYALSEMERVDAKALNESVLRQRTQALQALFGDEK